MTVPWVRLWYSDWLADVAHLGVAEVGCYFLLAMQYYQTGRPLPRDLDRCTRICRATEPETRKAVEFVLTEYFVADNDPEYGDVWRHMRIETELEWSQEEHRKKTEKGRKGAAASNRKQAESRKKDTPQTARATPGRHSGVAQVTPEHRPSIARASPEHRPSDARASPEHRPSDANQNHIPFPKGNGACAPEQPVDDVVWTTGIALLLQQTAEKDVDVEEPRLRRWLGGLAKRYGQPALAQAIVDAQAVGPVDLRPWLVAACKRISEDRHVTGGSKRAPSSVSRFLDRIADG